MLLTHLEIKCEMTEISSSVAVLYKHSSALDGGEWSVSLFPGKLKVLLMSWLAGWTTDSICMHC
jgi:hypothetical protein